jgi:transposase
MRPSHTFPTKEDAMKQYVGLDVSQAETAVCVIDETGQTNWKGTCRSTPEAIGRILRQRASQAVTVAMETGPLAVWHWHALRDAGFPVVCLPARHAHAALSLQLNKTDRNDAAGLAQLVRTGWYRAVEVKSLESHTLRLVLATRTQLVSTRTTLFNQIRGLLKTFGIVLGKGKGHIFERLVTAGVQGVDHVRLAIDSLLWQHVTQEIKRFDREITAVTRRIPACQHVMTVPGVGPVTTLVYAATVDNPARFKRSTDVGAYLGLTPRRYQFAEVAIRLRAEFVYLAVMLDAYVRKVVGWALDRTLAARLPIAALAHALAERHPPPRLVHHSGRGVQYASEEYATLLRTHHMIPSMSQPANPYDNASCESFMKMFKRKEVYANTLGISTTCERTLRCSSSRTTIAAGYIRRWATTRRKSLSKRPVRRPPTTGATMRFFRPRARARAVSSSKDQGEATEAVGEATFIKPPCVLILVSQQRGFTPKICAQ